MNQSFDYNSSRQEHEGLFNELFRQHEPRLYTLAFRITKSEQIARDILQEVFLKLWLEREQISSIVNMEAWLYRVTENKVLDFLRKTAADTRMKKVVWENLQQMVNEAELHLAVKEYNLVIRQAIEQLPPQRKLIYRLHKEEGMNYRQIAEELNLSTHTVKNHLFSAVQSVRKFISRKVRIFSIFF